MTKLQQPPKNTMRYPRLDYPGARHHVMNRGARHAPVFVDEDVCAIFLQLLSDLPVRFGVRVHAYALMPNHYHLLLTSDRGDLPRAMRHLGGEFSRKVNNLYSWDGPIFRGRYRNRIVESTDYWRHLLLYVHANPVRAGLSTPDRAAGTSHSAYTGDVPAPPWLDMHEMRILYRNLLAYSDAWRAHVSGGLAEPEGFSAKELWQPQATGVAAAPLPPVDVLMVARSLDAVARVTGVGLDLLLGPTGRGVRRPERWLGAWWLSRGCGVPHGQIAAAFGVGHDSLSRMITRFEAELPSTPRWSGWIDQLKKMSDVNT